MPLVDGGLCLTDDARQVLEILSWLPYGSEGDVFDAWDGEDPVLVGRMLASLQVVGLVSQGGGRRPANAWSLTACGRLVVRNSDEIGEPRFAAARCEQGAG
jgi:hypothetical protein